MPTIRFLLITLALAWSVCHAAAQGQTGRAPQASPPAPQALTEAQRWMVADTRIASVQARTGFPRRIGTLTASRTQEFSHQGEGVDDALWYRSADGAVFATLYIYYPGLPHAGLAAFSTDLFIHTAEPATRIAAPLRLVRAGGVADGAIRIDYADYRGMASSAAFIKVGRWILKARISGPQDRRAEVEDAMTALLLGVEFGAQNPWMAPHPLTVTDCPADAGRTAARPLPDPAGAELAAHGLLATFDGGGTLATVQGSDARRDLPPRIPDRLCRASLRVGDQTYTLLRGEPGEPLSIDGRTMLVVILNDNGNALEVVQARNLNRYVLLYHEIGQTSLLGGFDGVPSDAQIAAILSGADRDGTRIRVPIRFRPNRGPEMVLPSISAPPGPSPARPPSQSQSGPGQTE
jgi:hypothetical protein